MDKSPEAGVYLINERMDLSIPLGQYAIVFQSEIFAILACVQTDQVSSCPGRNTIICSDIQAALKAVNLLHTPS